ncbi:MAG: class I SAM-dependent methyltransferase [Thermoanaerobaculia bacterium]
MSARSFSFPLGLDSKISGPERLYIRVFGTPILGLRIRARYLLPVLRDLEREPFRVIADAGSGRGLFALHLARRFPEAQVTGLDIDEDQVERNNSIATRLGYGNCSFRIQDVTRLDEGPPSDFILSTDNLEHLEDDRRQCGVFFRSLEPGGRILIHTPHETRKVFGLKRQNFMGIEGHVRPGYTVPGLSAMLEEAGFEIEQGFHSYGSFETLANDISYLITGGREKRRWLYAAAFPGLLLLSRLGRLSKPREGSGVVILARKPKSEPASVART